MAVVFPTVGRWYRRPNNSLFEVVAVDEQDGTVEIQHFDGTVEEIDFENWPDLLLERVAPPEDWSGAMDVDREDELHDTDGLLAVDWADPLEFLDRDRGFDFDELPD